MRVISNSRVQYSRVNTLAKIGANHFNAHLGPPDKGCAIKGLVVCYVVWLGSVQALF